MSEFKYQVGQLVRVRPDLKEGAFYAMKSGPSKMQEIFVLGQMTRFAGKVVRIKICTYEGFYKIQELDNCIWSDDMFTKPDTLFVCESLL